ILCLAAARRDVLEAKVIAEPDRGALPTDEESEATADDGAEVDGRDADRLSLVVLEPTATRRCGDAIARQRQATSRLDRERRTSVEMWRHRARRREIHAGEQGNLDVVEPNGCLDAVVGVLHALCGVQQLRLKLELRGDGYG